MRTPTQRPGARGRSVRIPAFDTGTAAAIAMRADLERDPVLLAACDPGYDEETRRRPMRNVVKERLDSLAGDPAAVDAFCMALTAYVGITAAGVGLDSAELARYLDERRRVQGRNAVPRPASVDATA